MTMLGCQRLPTTAKLGRRNGCYLDGNPVIILKICTTELAPLLSQLYNRCLALSFLPDYWEIHFCSSFFKNQGQPSDPWNYRARSLFFLPIFGNIPEIMRRKLINYKTSNGLLSDKYAFCFSRLTAAALMVIAEEVYQALDKNVMLLQISRKRFTLFGMLISTKNTITIQQVEQLGCFWLNI